ncbi:alpha/beta fold hydrolase [Streptomyces sp. N2-109]|uniref:Alpha/beta fold hydrolase n=1 Tax=Streptomyces gossypii TaxID=2883101 RepID=A0ABT2JXQ5_9ACTN|nr:alpha/beta fold hydrolase [Streptomyces gossypii]MCT2592044.1 alpha/beta fold hydrolase [Streptomyces gossypii]
MTATATDPWILRLNDTRDTAARLVAFPHAGGSASFFFGLGRALRSQVEVLGVQYPGRQERRTEKMIDNIPDMADQVFSRLNAWRDRPLVLLGHSLGAIVAFEVARRLEQETSTGVSGLIVSGRRAPSIIKDDEDLHLREDRDLLAEIRVLGGTDGGLLQDDELMQMILPAVRTDYKAIETYRMKPGPKLQCPVSVLTGDADPRVSLDEVQAWRDQTAGAVQFRVFPGGHFFITDHLDEVCKAISTDVAAFRPGGPVTAGGKRPGPGKSGPLDV